MRSSFNHFFKPTLTKISIFFMTQFVEAQNNNTNSTTQDNSSNSDNTWLVLGMVLGFAAVCLCKGLFGCHNKQNYPLLTDYRLMGGESTHNPTAENNMIETSKESFEPG